MQWLESELNFDKSRLTEAFSLDANYETTNWNRRRLWINPPWTLSDLAVEKLVNELPSPSPPSRTRRRSPSPPSRTRRT